MRRHLVLPARGALLISTDVHGNAGDFERLEAIFAEERTAEPQTHWVILGDVVHAPDAGARKSSPDLYDFDDGSMQIVDRILALEKEAPGYVHFVLGNHDHGHAGGPHTHKFHGDEVAALEATLSEAERDRLRGLCERALLAVAAPCGVLMTHGAPDTTFESLADLDDVPLDITAMSPTQAGMMRSLLTSYGQPDHVCIPMLANVSRASGLDLRVVVHGHDRDEKGFFREGGHQVCPVIFGAPRANKRYIRLDLSAHYEGAAEVREDFEILRLYGEGFVG
jgi:3',5'-cyclic AMP phosphodiesterase CpdA